VLNSRCLFLIYPTMKKGVHPTYHDDAKITCSCGATYTVGATIKKLSTELCSACHPFYTGKQKLVDTAGRVDKFQAKMKAAQALKSKGKKDKSEDGVEVKEEVKKKEPKKVEKDEAKKEVKEEKKDEEVKAETKTEEK